MASSSTLKWVLVGEDKTKGAFKSAASGLDVLADKSVKTGRALTIGVTAPLAGIAAVAVKSASDQEQAFGALDSVYGQAAGSLKVWAAEQSKVGLSTSEAANQAVYMGAMLKNAGLSAEEAAGRSTGLVQLGADLAATFGGPASDAVEALGALMRGEADPIERYGVSIKQSDVNARLAALGQDKLTGAARKQAEMAARLALVTEQTAAAQGQAAREADTFAGTTGRLKATLANTAAVAGTAVLPVVTDLAEKLSGMVSQFSEWFGGLSDGSQRMVVGFAATAAAIGPLLWGFGKAIQLGQGVVAGAQAVHRVWQVGSAIARVYALSTLESVKALAASGLAHVKSAALAAGHTAALVAHKTAALAVAAASKIFAAAQWLVNAAMTANPIGLVVAALAALAVGLKYAWDHSETFREVVTGVFKVVGNAVLTMAEYWLRGYQLMTNAFLSFVQMLLTGAAKAFGWVPGIGEKLRGAADAFGGFRSTVSGKFDAVIGKVGEWKTSLDQVDGKTATASVNVDASGAVKGSKEAQSAIDGVEGKTVDVKINFTTGKVDRSKLPPWLGGTANVGGLYGPSDGDAGSGRSAGLLGATRGVGSLGAGFAKWGPAWSWNRTNGRGQHDGADITAPYGTPVVATRSGTVTGVGRSGWAGNHVVWSSGGTQFIYAHLSTIAAKVGAIRAGQVLGRVGSTGHSYGPHLHVQASRSGSYVNPAAWLASGGIVTRPMVVGVGEAGPEAILPLRDRDRLGGDTITININGGLDSSEAIARRVQTVLLDLKRRQGVGLGLA